MSKAWPEARERRAPKLGSKGETVGSVHGGPREQRNFQAVQAVRQLIQGVGEDDKDIRITLRQITEGRR